MTLVRKEVGLGPKAGEEVKMIKGRLTNLHTGHIQDLILDTDTTKNIEVIDQGIEVIEIGIEEDLLEIEMIELKEVATMIEIEVATMTEIEVDMEIEIRKEVIEMIEIIEREAIEIGKEKEVVTKTVTVATRGLQDQQIATIEEKTQEKKVQRI
jgi:hypothetical protein